MVQKWLVTGELAEQREYFQRCSAGVAGSRLEVRSAGTAWYDAARTGEILPDRGIASALAAMVTEAG